MVVHEGWDVSTTTPNGLEQNQSVPRRIDEVVVVEVDTLSETEQLSTEVSFEDILKTVLFLLATFLAANLSKIVTLPSFVGEIIAGVVLGPPVLNFCPYPEAMVLIGSFGLIGLVLNSGIDLDIAQLRETGTRSVMIAISGTILALSTGIGVSYLVDANNIQSAFSVGAAFAPSSWGVASQVLSKGEVLNTPIGQTIMASSVVDDILGLVLLSILQVFVMDNPTTFDYIKPFLASFGYLLVLGLAGITIIPRVLKNHFLPKFPEHQQDAVAIGLMFILMTIYLPMMNYTGASYLTGAFLAGVSFSQLHHAHATFAKSSHEVMVWLMRIFFAATIGFQVPVTYFSEPHVLRKGCIFRKSQSNEQPISPFAQHDPHFKMQHNPVIPVLSKFLLGFLTPGFNRDTPVDFPYNPYWRDFLITSLSMVCRGEFNFVVAAVALRARLLTPGQYAGVVFAVLISCIVSPLVLARLIAYYNKKSYEYLDQSHPVQRIGDTCDGYRPLYLAIQARTPVNWGFHEKLEKTLEAAGLIIIDHRSWHTLGYEDGVDITEIFCQDKQVQVKIPGYFANETKTVAKPSARRSALGNDGISGKVSAIFEESERSDAAGTFSISSDVEALIEERKAEIKELITNMLGSNLDPADYAIQVSEWETFSFQKDPEQPNGEDNTEKRGYCFFADSSQKNLSDVGFEDGAAEKDHPFVAEKDHPLAATKPMPSKPTYHRRGSSLSLSRNVLNRAVSNASGVESIGDLWDTDAECHQLARGGYYQTPRKDGSSAVNVEEGCHLEHMTPRHHRTESNVTHHRNRSRAGSAVSLVSFDLDVELSSPPHDTEVAIPERQQEAQETPPPAAQARRRNLHQRNHTLDVSMLDSYELESSTIKERLQGYVR
jgi:Kef-type K+ transport system membrane component KefB